MKTDDKLEPNAQELKGHVEEAAGKALGDDGLVAHGKADQIAAHAKQAASQAASQAGKAATQAGEAARHLGKRVRERAHLGRRVRDRAVHTLSGLHQRLHEVAEEERQSAAKGDGDGRAS